jgi:hypothetical protein
MLPDIKTIVSNYRKRENEKSVEDHLAELKEKFNEYYVGKPLRFSNDCCSGRGVTRSFLVIEASMHSQMQRLADSIFYPETGYRVIINRLLSSTGALRMMFVDEMGDFIRYESFEIGEL